MVQNSHWLGYTLGGVSAAGLMYYFFTHETQTQANADGASHTSFLGTGKEQLPWHLMLS